MFIRIILLLLIFISSLFISCSNYKATSPYDNNNINNNDNIININDDLYAVGPEATDFDIEYNMREYYKQFNKYKIIVKGNINGSKTLEYIKQIINKEYYKEQKIEVDLSRTTLTSIPQEAFMSSATLSAIVFPETLEEIAISAFQGCTSLTSVTLPSSLSILRHHSFAGCSELQTVIFNDNLKTIANKAFYNCKKLNNVVLPPNITSLETSTFDNCILLTSIKLNDKLEEIGANVFQNCSGLVNISLPSSLTSINSTSFALCTNLKNVEYLGDTPTITDTPFSSSAVPTDLYLPNVPEAPSSNSWDKFLGVTWEADKIHYGQSMPNN
ncbi:leucine-rich repeat domain-containing protein [Brachyspira hampsonii]|uniref:Cell surface protein n=1 Tax=Brachyspira hampsonii TaxID=1287055 RepID=A0AAC9TTJ2_9SPIR|nr:leucine-rich repeat domain-containing protein [Brachyspira hampsonii]ASJ20974.1 hypothetical protein BHAMNSH16_04670 [Brachyspira hampsonii]ELV06757.1 hypothetical protein H263_02170 [Brachyspira hampsonii 30599]MBW5380000.1 leucine-rich repeat domain-containing protein [Brachyspira hampsonii]OEJ13296.1 hypothetical protein A9496_02500 [Brachyspira hampsonii]